MEIRIIRFFFCHALSKYMQSTSSCVERDGQGYYSGVRFQMYARDQAGTEYFIVDGGFTDWTQQLLSNHKERLLISGMGSERFVSLFG